MVLFVFSPVRACPVLCPEPVPVSVLCHGLCLVVSSGRQAIQGLIDAARPLYRFFIVMQRIKPWASPGPVGLGMGSDRPGPSKPKSLKTDSPPMRPCSARPARAPPCPDQPRHAPIKARPMPWHHPAPVVPCRAPRASTQPHTSRTRSRARHIQGGLGRGHGGASGGVEWSPSLAYLTQI